MLRVLLLVDEYRELVFLQTLLKKIGFDVDGTQNANKYEEKTLAMNPELIIASSKGKSINGLQIAEKLKQHNGIPKFVLIVPQRMAQQVHGLQLKNVDGIIDSPIDAKKLLATIAKVSDLNSEGLVAKYNKMIINLDADNEEDLHLLKMQNSEVATSSPKKASAPPGQQGAQSQGKKINLSPCSISEQDRQDRMEKALKEIEMPTADGFSKDVVHKWNKRIRSEESNIDINDLEDERQRFVKSMFKKTDS